MSAAYLNRSVGDKHHRKITDLNVLGTDLEAVSPVTDSCKLHFSDVS